MPELPEVETVRRGLERVVGKTLLEVQVLDSWLRRDVPNNLNLLHDATLQAVHRRAKYLILQFTNDRRLVIHLGMTGRLTFRGDAEKHDKVLWIFDGAQKLYFNDSRRFGYVDWYENINWQKLGLEPFAAEFTAEYLVEQLKKKREAIKLFLLDQRYIVGLGNIYVCEALYLAAINPFKPCDSLSYDECQMLVVSIKTVLAKAIEMGGSSLRDYRGVDGRSGDYQKEFLVYDHAGDECKKHPQIVGSILKVKQAGRSTYYCPVCQQ